MAAAHPGRGVSSNPRGIGDAAPYGWMRDTPKAEPGADAERALSGNVRVTRNAGHAPPPSCDAAQQRARAARYTRPTLILRPKTHVVLQLSAREAKARFWRLKRIPIRDTQPPSKQPPNPPQALCAPRSTAQALFLSGARGRFLLASTKESAPGKNRRPCMAGRQHE